MAYSKFSDEDLMDLIRSWSLTSPDYEIGVGIPVKNSEIEEQGSPPVNCGFSIELSPMEMKFGKEMLEKVCENLVNFSLMCRSKVSLEKLRDFDDCLPNACANLVRGIIDEKLTVKPPSTSRYYVNPSFDGLKDDSTGDFDLLAKLMQEFLTLSRSREENCHDDSSYFHEDNEVNLVDLSSSPEDGSTPPVPLRPKTPRPNDLNVLSDAEANDVVGLVPEGVINPDVQPRSLGARPKIFRSRKWKKRHSVRFE